MGRNKSSDKFDYPGSHVVCDVRSVSIRDRSHALAAPIRAATTGKGAVPEEMYEQFSVAALS
jgi:hypothetical protein